MRIQIHDIAESPKEFFWEEPTDELNKLFAQGSVRDYIFTRPVAIEVRCYRAGLELFFAGQAAGAVTGSCARCLESFDFQLQVPYAFVLVPHGHGGAGDDLEEEDVNLSFYRGHEVDLSPLVREQIILALPMQPLCRDDCRGLCGSCGANLNDAGCACMGDVGGPWLAAFAELRARRRR